MFKKALVILTFLLILTACKAIRPLAATNLKIVFREDGFSLSAQHVIAGASITVNADNPTASGHLFMMLSEPLSKGIESLDPRHVLYQLKIPGSQSVTGLFQAPLAPGEYWLICAEPGHIEQGESGKIVVVHPDYTR